MAKPSIIHNKHLYAKFRSSLCNREKFFCIKIKISCFPVVNQNWAFYMCVLTANHMITIKIMQITCHIAHTFRRESQNNFRSSKTLSLLKFPAKIFCIDSHRYTDWFKLAFFNLRLKISRINKVHCIYIALCLCRIRIHPCNKRMFLMWRLSTDRTYALLSITKLFAFNLTFSRPWAMQCQPFIITIIHIDACWIYFRQIYRICAMINHTNTSRNNIFFFKDGV